MKAHAPTSVLIKLKGKPWSMLMAVVILISLLSSCHKEVWYGSDGHPGHAYLSLTWIDDKPDYIDAGTGDIPPVFEYGKYYLAWPGWYTMYYEGRFWNGQASVFYAWEVDYDIWTLEGERGGLYYHGADGPDNYFTVECSPYGPWVYGPGYKTVKLPDGFELVESDEDKIIISKEGTHLGITLTYRKVIARDHNSATE